MHGEERVLEGWKKSKLVPMYKEKDYIQDCKHYTGVKLMSPSMEKSSIRELGRKCESQRSS